MGNIGQRCKKLDIYGAPIMLNFRGDDSHRTYWGAFWSLVTQGILLSYFISQATILYMKSDPYAISYKIKRATEGEPAYNLKENGLEIAI